MSFRLLLHSLLLLVLLCLSVQMTALAAPLYPGLVNQADEFDGPFSVLATLEQPAFSDDWRQQRQVNVPQGGHAAVILALNPASLCQDISGLPTDASVFVLMGTDLQTPSSEQTPKGRYYDLLLPLSPETCHLSPFRFLDWQPQAEGDLRLRSGEQAVVLSLAYDGTFSGPSKPFFLGLSNSFLLSGHCPTYCKREEELGQLYEQLLKDHHSIPYRTWVQVPPLTAEGLLDLDYHADSGQSFRQRSLQIDPTYVIWPRSVLYPEQKDAYLRALNRTVLNQVYPKTEGDPVNWIYVQDEPTDFNSLTNDLRSYRRFAPDLRTMVTTAPRPDLSGLIDIYAPNLALWQSGDPLYDGKQVWPYVSCHGSCGPSRRAQPSAPRDPGPEPGQPDFLIDRPAQRLFTYFRLLADQKADGGLYYHAVEGYPLTRQGIDLYRDPWNFGGNGDGLLVYPGRPGDWGLTRHQPLPSLRLKLIRQAIETYWRQ